MDACIEYIWFNWFNSLKIPQETMNMGVRNWKWWCCTVSARDEVTTASRRPYKIVSPCVLPPTTVFPVYERIVKRSQPLFRVRPQGPKCIRSLLSTASSTSVHSISTVPCLRRACSLHELRQYYCRSKIHFFTLSECHDHKLGDPGVGQQGAATRIVSVCASLRQQELCVCAQVCANKNWGDDKSLLASLWVRWRANCDRRKSTPQVNHARKWITFKKNLKIHVITFLQL